MILLDLSKRDDIILQSKSLVLNGFDDVLSLGIIFW